MTQISIGSNVLASYTYDLMGNRLTEQSNRSISDINKNITYSYDVENKLKTVTKNGTTTSMSYYADGMRAGKQTGNNRTSYVYNQSGQLTAEVDSSNKVTANYVWGPDRVLVKKQADGGEYYYLYNGRGDVVQMVDRFGNVVNNYEYDKWGNIATSNETISNPFKYAGEVYDKETGLYYLRARYYDPKMGRFLNEDSIEGQVKNPLTLNLYTYCVNNPVNNIDPTGHVSKKIAAQLIKDNADYIISAAKEYDLDPAMLAACIYAEQVKNVTYTEGLEDWTQQFLGMNCSAGIAQVRISTAEKVENAGYIEVIDDLIRYSTNYIFGIKVTNKDVITREERIYEKLIDNQTNIRYAAAYLALIKDKWRDTYPKIESDTAILATLYNISENGTKGVYSNPKPNPSASLQEKIMII